MATSVEEQSWKSPTTGSTNSGLAGLDSTMSFAETRALNVSPDEALTQAATAAGRLGWGVTESNPRQRTFSALTSAGARSFGETVTVSVSSMGDGSEIRVRSKCRAQLVSWGKNRENVVRLFQAIQQAQVSSAETEVEPVDSTAVVPDAFCTSCGAAIRDRNRFCGRCGSAVNANTASAVSSPGVVLPLQPQRQATNFVGLSDYYQNEFRMIGGSGERYQGKWNWAAFFFGAIWALTKGLWVPALICVVASIFTGGIAGVIYWFIFGARGNYMYYRKITRGLNPAY